MTKKLTIADVDWELECLPEEIAIRGNVLASGDDEEDAKAEEWVQTELDAGNQWAWCFVRLTGRFKGLEADDSLGACSYLSEEEFRQPGGYFDDMQANVLADLQAQLEDICAECC